MPTQNVTASLQGRVGLFAFNIGSNNWLSAIRNASTGSQADTFTTTSSQSQMIRVSHAFGRSGVSGSIYRGFFFFDVSSIPGTITGATMQITGYSQSSSDAFIVESTAWGGNGSSTTMTTAMYNDLDFSQPYSQSSISNWSTSTSSPNQFIINTQGISDMNSNGYLNVALINYTNDYSGTQPLINTTFMAGALIQNSTYPVRLVVTYTSGYSHDVIGVANTSIDEVNAVGTANISKVIGV